MPQASASTEDAFRREFDRDPDDCLALDYLASVGIKDNRGWFTVSDDQLNDGKTRAALMYLAEEWDYAF